VIVVRGQHQGCVAVSFLDTVDWSARRESFTNPIEVSDHCWSVKLVHVFDPPNDLPLNRERQLNAG
jgi:hypothetical protein